MNTEDLTRTIAELPVFDTHSHLNAPGRPLAARNFSDIAHYFWLSQQLKGVGWQEREAWDRDAAQAYFDAFIKTENTSINWCMRRILKDLYGITLRSAEDILSADAIIRERAATPDHVEAVCRKGQIKKVVQNLETQAPFPGAPGLGVLVADHLNAPVASFLDAPSEEALDKTVAALGDTVDAMAQKGEAGARLDFNLLESTENARWRKALLDAIFARLHHHRMFVQLFMGMKRHSQGSFPQNDPERITGLYPYFREYPGCRFELVCAAEGNTMDVVQAAVANPNVIAGGPWWYSFRPSIFRQTMQYRLEALAPLKCPVLASDATCIEWCYGKAMLVKTLVAEVLAGNVKAGWLSADCALRTASAWLYDAPAAYYQP
jgi:hypothetical protein